MTVPTLRLLSYNVRSVRDDASALARVIRAAEPDVVCVQEAPRLLRWRSKCAALARRSGLVVVAGGRLAAGNLIMSTLGVEVVDVAAQRFSADRGRHRRGAALALLQWHGVCFVVAGTHLDLVAEPRLRHVHELHSVLGRFGGADLVSVIAADVNDTPGSAPWRALTERRRDAFAVAGVGDGFTYDAVRPVRRIDAVFADVRIQVVSATVLAGPDVAVASDHRPLLVELGLS